MPTALVIENDPLQLALFERGLLDLGVKVYSATGFGAKVAGLFSIEEFDLVLLDFELGPGPNGVDVANFVRLISPQTKLVLISSFVDIWVSADDAARGIFSQLILKRDIDSLEQFKRLMSPLLRGHRAQPRLPAPAKNPSKGALLIWRLIALGLTNLEISSQIGLSVKSVEKTISQLGSSLGISNSSGNLRVQLVRKYVERNGQLPTE